MVSLRPQMPGVTIGPPPGPKEISAQTARKAAATLEAARRGARRAGQEAQDAVPCWPLDPRADGGEEGPPSGPKQNLTPNPVSASTGLREGSERPGVVAEADEDGEGEEERNTASQARRHPSGGARRWHEQQHTARRLCVSRARRLAAGGHEHIRSNNLHAANRTRAATRDPNVARGDRREI